MIKVINESLEWSDLNGTEQNAAEYAIDAMKNGSHTDVEEAVRDGCSVYNNGNMEYPDEDIYDEEANYDTVLSFVKFKLGE